MIPVGIRNKYLTIFLTRDKTNNLLHPTGIQFIKDIIEQQQRRRVARRSFQKTELCQLQGNHKGLMLSLTAFTLYGIATEQHFQVITMYAMQRIAHGTVFHTVTLNHVQ